MRIGGLIGEIGPLLSRREGASWRYALRTREAHGNAIGVIHGGTLMTLLDQTATLAALWSTGSKTLVTVQMDTRFLSSARVGELLEAEGSLRHRTRSTLFLDVGISVGDRAVADARAIMKIVPATGEGGRGDD